MGVFNTISKSMLGIRMIRWLILSLIAFAIIVPYFPEFYSHKKMTLGYFEILSLMFKNPRDTLNYLRSNSVIFIIAFGFAWFVVKKNSQDYSINEM